MTFEEQGDRLVVHHKARTGFLSYMGLIAMFLLPCSVLMFVVNVSSPRNIALACDRAQDQCMVTPVSAGWDSREFPISQLADVHVEGTGSKQMIFLGEAGKSPHYQLSKAAGSTEVADQYVKAVEQAHAFANSSEPTMRVVYPSGEQGMPWLAAVLTFAFAVVWLLQLLRAPKGLELIVDKGKREVVINRKFFRRTDSQTHSLDQIARVASVGSKTSMSVVTVSLVFKDGKSVLLFDEGAFAAAKADAALLMQKLNSFAGLETASV